MKNKITIITSLIAGLLILSSCLKDSADYWSEDVAGKSYATIAFPGLQTKSLLLIPDKVTVEFLVNIATDELPTSDITVDLAFDDAAITEYNAINKAKAIANKDTTPTGAPNYKHFKPYPSRVLETPQVVIKAGTRNVLARMSVDRADTLSLTGNYMNAVSIVSVSGGIPIGGNMKTVLYAFPIANEWEGEYLSEGHRLHPSLGFEPFNYPKLVFSTVNSNTVHKDQVGNYGGYGLDITITTNTVVVGGVTVFKCDLQITGMADPGDMIIYPDFEGATMNYYNPVTKVFELYYAYNKAAPRKLRETNSRL